MSFGAVLTSGDQNELLPSDLMDSVTEVRVEQYLDRPTEFAVRFQEDLSDGEPRVSGSPEVRTERMFAIAVPVADGVLCLVRGPITDSRYSMQLGGPGSWFEIRGRDRRVEMDRQCFRHAWEGRASEAAETVLSSYGFQTEVQQTTRQYSARDGTLNQRGTDLAFVNRIARLNNLVLWLAYDCRLNGLDPARGRLQVQEKAYLRASPPRPADSPSAASSPAQVPLAPTTELRLRVNVDSSRCQNVTSFDMDMSVERPNRYEGSALDDRDVREDATSLEDSQPPVRSDGQRLRDLTGRSRQVCVTSPGTLEELRPRAEAAVTEAGWFLNATASTTAHMLGGVLMPHAVIQVDGLGRRHSGAYQVAAVTHVVTAADHRIDLGLRRNSLGRDS